MGETEEKAITKTDKPIDPKKIMEILEGHGSADEIMVEVLLPLRTLCR